MLRLEKEDIQKIQELNIYKTLDNIQISKGWLPKVLEMGKEIEVLCQEEKIPLPKIMQVKSKFGTLRFYYRDETNNQRLKDLINLWHCNIDHICEYCGASEASVDKHRHRWITLCEKCSGAVN